MSEAPLSAIVLRFTVGRTGTIHCRITDAVDGRSWAVPDAAELYAELRRYLRDDAESTPGRG